MTFLTILGVMRILCSFRLVLEGKSDKEIPESSRLEFLEKFLANNFALSDVEGNTSSPLNRGGIADLRLLRRLSAILQVPRVKFLRSFWELYQQLFRNFLINSFQSNIAFFIENSNLTCTVNQMASFYMLCNTGIK